MDTIALPTDLLPGDGRFGSGPSRVRGPQLDALVAVGETVLGTSHRQRPVRAVVGSVRERLATLLGAPDGYEVVLGNGGTTALWDAMVFGLIRDRAQFAHYGEFGQKFAAAAARAPVLGDPDERVAEPGSIARPAPAEGIDAYAHPHNETSTGVIAPVERIGDDEALTLVDATSAAGGAAVDLTQADVYYFAPQKCFASDGGLWFAVMSPAAVARAQELCAQRWVPEFLDLGVAIANSRKDQTLNTPAVATLVLLDAQLGWMLDNGGLEFTAARTAASAEVLYGWAEASDYATPFVADPALRSPVVGTIDLDERVDHAAVCAPLRANGVVDVFPYRKLGRNQLRVGMFPAVPTEDVEALTACLDYLVERL